MSKMDDWNDNEKDDWDEGEDIDLGGSGWFIAAAIMIACVFIYSTAKLISMIVS